MFESVEIECFRGIRKCERPIELSKFNVLIGPNNSGKSSILEALFLFPPFPHWNLKILGRTRRDTLAELHSDGAFAYRYAGEALVKYKVENRDVSIKLSPILTLNECIVSEKRVSDIHPLSEIFRGGTAEHMVDELINYSLFIPNSDSFIHKLSAEEFNNWPLIEATDAHVWIIRDVIRKAVEDMLTEVALKKNEMVVRKEFPQGGAAYLSIKDQGDGVERFVIAALWLEAVRPKVVLWDDFEASAHPSLVRESLRWLSSREWQVVLSTHSIDVLSEVVEVAPTDSKVLVLRKKPDDTLVYKSYPIDELEDFIEKGLDPRKLLSW